MKFLFFTPDLSQLKWYVPLIKGIKTHDPSLEITVAYVRTNVKYNGLNSDSNFKTLSDIVSKLPINSFVDAKTLDSSSHFDIIFSIEGYGIGELNVKHDLHVAIQNNFDYRGSCQKVNKQKALYAVTSHQYGEEIKKLCGINYVVTEVPITFFDWGDSLVEGRRITDGVTNNILIYYPEQQMISLVVDVINSLQDLGFNVLIKQRRKNQTVALRTDLIKSVKVYYDDVWYPSETIALPLASLCSIGFGTSAYVDNVEFDLKFVDVPIPDYSKTYYKPLSNAAYRMATSDASKCIPSILNNTLELLSLDLKHKQPAQDVLIADFLKKIMT